MHTVIDECKQGRKRKRRHKECDKTKLPQLCKQRAKKVQLNNTNLDDHFEVLLKQAGGWLWAKVEQLQQVNDETSIKHFVMSRYIVLPRIDEWLWGRDNTLLLSAAARALELLPQRV